MDNLIDKKEISRLDKSANKTGRDMLNYTTDYTRDRLVQNLIKESLGDDTDSL
jgi:hypothetical protein